MTDALDFPVKIAAPFCLKQNTNPIISFLISNTGLFTLYDLIRDIKSTNAINALS